MAVLAIVLTVATIYSNSLDCEFIFDDLSNIVEWNEQVHRDGLKLSNLFRAVFDGPSSNRPVAKLTFALNYWFGLAEVSGYHIVNVVIHILNGFLVYWLACLILGGLARAMVRRRPDAAMDADEAVARPNNSRDQRLALMAAIVFVAHPLQTQAVTYVVQRMASLSAMFCFASFGCYLIGRNSYGKRRIVQWCAGGLLWLFALGCKENAIMLPPAILLSDWFFYGDLRVHWIVQRKLVLGIAAIVVAGIAWVYLEAVPAYSRSYSLSLDEEPLRDVSKIVKPPHSTFNPLERLRAGYHFRDFTMSERVFTQFRVVVFYLSLLIFPSPERLNLTHWLEPSSGLLRPATTVSACFVLVAVGGTCVAMARRYRLVAFGILWLFLLLVVESSVVSLEIVYEHRLYLPMFGGVLALVGLLDRLDISCRRLTMLTRVLAIGLGYATICRNQSWETQIVMWTDVIKKNRRDARPPYNRGRVYHRKNNVEAAVRDYREAIQRDSTYYLAYNNLANLYTENERFDEALNLFDEAIRLRPKHPMLLTSRGSTYMRLDQLDLAERDFQRALELKADFSLAHYNLGSLAATRNKSGEAIQHYTRAIESDPSMFVAFVNRGNAFLRERRFKQALDDYDTAVILRPRSIHVVFSRAVCAMQSGSFELAINGFNDTLQLQRNHAGAWDNLAWILATCPHPKFRDGKRAVTAARNACELTGFTGVRQLNTLAAAHAEAGQFDEAVRTQQRSLKLLSGKEAAAMRQRLRRYQTGQPYHER